MIETLSRNIVRIPIAIYVIGFLVHNFYLSKFNIYDFEIIQVRYIYAGFMALLFVIAAYLFTFLKLNLSNLDNNFTPKNVYFWIYRISLLCIVTYITISSPQNITSLDIPPLHAIFSKKTSDFIILGLPALLFLSLLFSSEINIKYPSEFKRKFTDILTILSSPIVFIITYLFIQYAQDYKNIYAYFFYIWISAVVFLNARIDSSNGFRTFHLDINTDEKTQNIFSITFSAVMFLIAVGLVLNNYSKSIYPLISTAFGGGKSSSALINTSTHNYSGMLLSDGDSWLYLKTENEDIHKIRKDTINEIILISKPK
jgi:hypothetical protein